MGWGGPNQARVGRRVDEPVDPSNACWLKIFWSVVHLFENYCFIVSARGGESKKIKVREENTKETNTSHEPRNFY